MDILGTGSIYLELMYELPSASSITLGDVQNMVSDNVPDLNCLESNAALRYCGVGGSGANIIYALSKLKYSVGFLGVIGKDEAGYKIIQQLHNVDTSLIRKFNDSGLKISVFQGSQKSTFIFSNSNNYLSFIEDDLGTINSSKYLCMGSIDNVNSLKAYDQMLNLLEEDIPVFFMPGEIVKSAPKEALSIISKSRVLFVTDDEINALSGMSSENQFQKLLSLGVKAIVCKGPAGVQVVSKHTHIKVPVKKTVLVDDSDSLDSFAAGFISAYMEGCSLESCGNAGAKLSALTSTAYGRDAYPDFKFLKHLLPENE